MINSLSFNCHKMRQKQIKCQQKLSNKNIVRSYICIFGKNFAQLAFEYSRVGQNIKTIKPQSQK